jgi:uncharacterized protein (DUF4213/DUF364 family)
MTEQEKELEHYRKLFSLAEHDVAVSGYVAYVNIVRQQVEHINDFKIKDNIERKKTETVLYDRTVAMWEKLPDMISRMNSLKNELKIDFDPEGDKPKAGAISPQSIAKLNGKQE